MKDLILKPETIEAIIEARKFLTGKANMIDKLKIKFETAQQKYIQSKHTIDDIRKYRNACQRILNVINKNEIKRTEDNWDFLSLLHKQYEWAKDQIKELSSLGILQKR